ncbi:hypothetical protein RhiJN_28708 [Ceratobasidium sp. AG-Ba]|nr:hypothetical protein RhiJN_28708 [Ceratobasidium sp. AG-Ba]
MRAPKIREELKIVVQTNTTIASHYEPSVVEVKKWNQAVGFVMNGTVGQEDGPPLPRPPRQIQSANIFASILPPNSAILVEEDNKLLECNEQSHPKKITFMWRAGHNLRGPLHNVVSLAEACSGHVPMPTSASNVTVPHLFFKSRIKTMAVPIDLHTRLKTIDAVDAVCSVRAFDLASSSACNLPVEERGLHPASPPSTLRGSDDGNSNSTRYDHSMVVMADENNPGFEQSDGRPAPSSSTSHYLDTSPYPSLAVACFSKEVEAEANRRLSLYAHLRLDKDGVSEDEVDLLFITTLLQNVALSSENLRYIRHMVADL